MIEKNILITGGAGFIGSHIAEYLLNINVKKIRIMDNLSNGKIENIKHLLSNFDNIEFIYGDIKNLEDCRKCVKDMDCICHQAALGSVPRSVKEPSIYNSNNVDGFFNIIIAAREVDIKRIVYASSSSVYGDEKNLPKKEDIVGLPLSPYAATKKINEIYAQVFSKCYNMEIIGLRYFNIFGPRQDPNGMYAAVIPKFIKSIMNKESPIINGNGEYSRDFTYIENAVNANILALTTENKKCFGEVFNIASGERIKIIELFQILKEELKIEISNIFGPERDGDIPHSNADINKAKNFLGYYPIVSFREGIKKMCKLQLK